MEARHFDPLLTDVAKHFARPRDILADERFTRQQKLKLLEQWDYDLQLLMTASEENMPSGDDNSSGQTGEQVAELRQALADLGAPHDPEAVGPGKVGAPVVEKRRRTTH
jgi:hypothetical protein